MWSNGSAPSLLGGRQNGTATLEDSFLQKEANPSYHDSAIMLLGIYLEELKNLSAQRNLHMDVSSNFIHNCQNSQAIGCPSAGEWINKL